MNIKSKYPDDYWDVAYKYHKELLNYKPMDELPIPSSWSWGLIDKLFIGWDKRLKCFTFPHFDSEGKIINVHWHKGKSMGDGV